MNFRPFVECELRRDARRWPTYWRRVALGMAGVIVAMTLVFQALQAPATAHMVFATGGYILLLYLLFTGIKNTADTLSMEVREGTLGLLFLSGLRSREIVLGKLLAGGTRAFYDAMVFVPAGVLVLLVSRWSLAGFMAVVSALAVALIVALAVGMSFSAFHREKRRSEGSAIAAMVLLGIFIPQFARLATADNFWLGVLRQGARFTPGYLFTSAIQLKEWWDAEFWGALGLNLVFAAASVSLAGWRLTRLWARQARPAGSYVKMVAPRKRRFSRPDLLRINPVAWLLSREATAPARIWSSLIVIPTLALGYGLAAMPNSPVLAAGAYYFLLKILFAQQAARALADLKGDGRLTQLATTSLRTEEIASGYFLTLRNLFAGPVAGFALLSAAVYGLLGLAPFAGSWNWPAARAPVLLGAANLMLWADLYAMAWLGLWCGVRERNQREAVSAVLRKTLIFPALLILVTAVIFAPSGFNGPEFLIVTWFIIGLLNAFYFAAMARRNALGRLHHWVLPHHEIADEMGQWGGRLGRRYALLRRRFRGARPGLSNQGLSSG